MKGLKIQWHPGFVAAMDLELRESRDDLWFEKEYNLNTKPLEIIKRLISSSLKKNSIDSPEDITEVEMTIEIENDSYRTIAEPGATFTVE